MHSTSRNVWTLEDLMKRMLLIGLTVKECFSLSEGLLETLQRIQPQSLDRNVYDLRDFEFPFLRLCQNRVRFVAYSYAVLVPHVVSEVNPPYQNNVITQSKR